MRIGELFAGYGGLGLGVKQAIGGEVVWVSDIDPGANRILEHRFPGVPNLGDIAAVDWSQVEPVDVLTGGFPCQDVSAAGKRAGIRPGTRSGLWSMFAYAISQLRPSLVVIENVRGLLSARAHSDVEPCPWCVGDEPDGALRALGAVLGDLATLGFDAEWVGLPASSVGAPHGRWREFIAAYPNDAGRREHRRSVAVGPQLTTAERGGSPSDPACGQRGEGWPEPARLIGGPDAAERGGATGPLLPTPVADNSRGLPSSGTDYSSLPNAVCALLPTPAVNDMGEGKTPDAWDEWTTKMQAEHGNGNGHGKSLAIEAQRLLPTPRVSADRTGRDALTREGHWSAPGLGQAVELASGVLPREYRSWDEVQGNQPTTWGDYAPAIARWEHVLGRPAPAPTETGPKGSPRLSPAFVEWMMGLPAGWVTEVPGLTRNAQLKALGNGVVSQQAEAALRWLLAAGEVAA